jgi:thiosulfate/3-mercaptopyruvate sulfurtransferase
LNDPLPPLVSTEWLAASLGTSGIRVVDASWYLPGTARDAAAEYRAAHIPGTVFFDIDGISDQQSPLPHMLPRVADFAARMAELGLNNSDTLVIYDGSGVNLSAGRVWWTFRTFGHEQVAVLDGGMGKWRAEHRPVEQGTVTLPPGSFSARLDPGAVRNLAAVRANILNRSEQLIDVRARGRFDGIDPEPRPGLRRGHVPGSINIPFTELVSPDGTLLPRDALCRRLADAGVDLDRPIVATCGSGTSACALVLALHSIGHTETAVYDGAWSEWGARSDTPVEQTRHAE